MAKIYLLPGNDPRGAKIEITPAQLIDLYQYDGDDANDIDLDSIGYILGRDVPAFDSMMQYIAAVDAGLESAIAYYLTVARDDIIIAAGGNV